MKYFFDVLITIFTFWNILFTQHQYEELEKMKNELDALNQRANYCVTYCEIKEGVEQ